MKRNATIIIVLTAIITSSCGGLTDYTADVSSSYLLPYGAKRKYEKKDYWLDPFTHEPVLKVSGSTGTLIHMPDSLIQKGLAVSEKRVEVSEQPKSGGTSQNGDIVMGRVSHNYTLMHEINKAETGHDGSSWPVKMPDFDPTANNYREGGWHETALGVYHVLNGNIVTVLDKPLLVGKHWRRTTTHYKDKNGISEPIVVDVRVVDKDSVHVSAGDFIAYKLAVTQSWPAMNVTQAPSYEYWVPGVGKVLEQSTIYRGILILSSNGTSKNIEYLDQSREELVSYSS